MKIIPRLAFFLSIIALLTACAAPHPHATLYDFGSPNLSQQATSPIPPIAIADPRTPSWLDSTQMTYRLRYANEQQANAYANSRWVMPPVQLFTERLKSRLSQAGTVLSAADGALNVPVLYLEMNDFSQSFDAPNISTVHINVRASVFQGRALTGQKTFDKGLDAPSADAPGGAKALADASDVLIAELMAWLASLSK